MRILSKPLLRQGLTVFPVALTLFVFGCIFGWVAPTMAHLRSSKSSFTVSESEISWIASAYFAAELMCALVVWVFSNTFGRKPTLLCATFLLMLSWILKIFASSAIIIILSRALMGIAAGIFDVTWATYVGEVASSTERGIFGSLMTSSFISGVMIEILLSVFLPYAYLNIIPFLLVVTSLILMFFIVEAPQYLILRGNYEAASLNLAWLRGYDEVSSVKEEFDEMKKYIEEEKGTPQSIKQFIKSPSEYKTTIVGVLIFTLAQPSGNISILSFEPLMLNLFNDFPLADSLTFLYSLLQFVFINVNPFLIENAGRKKLLIFGFGTSAVIQISCTGLFYIEEQTQHTVPYVAYIITALFNLYGIIFVSCIFPTVYVLKSELFPQELKAIASGFSTATNALADFIVVRLFVWIWLSYGLYVNFILYSAICIISVVYVYTLIPETKGKSLVEIQQNIKTKRSTQRANNTDESQS